MLETHIEVALEKVIECINLANSNDKPSFKLLLRKLFS